MQEYLLWHGERVSARTLDTDSHRLTGFFRLKDPTWSERPLSALLEDAAKLYELRVPEVAADTHRNELCLAGRVATWWMKAPRQYLPRNPFSKDDIEPTGRRRKRTLEAQPRWNEARALYEAVLADSSVEATATLTAILMGLRASEIVTRKVRDLDDNGRLLWIPDSKTPNGIGILEVPGVLQPRLRAIADYRAPESPLFGEVDRHWFHRVVKAYGRRVGLVVTPHLLRGLHATGAIRGGATGEMVARALGHDGPSITRTTYITPGTERIMVGSRVTRMLDVSTPGVTQDDQPIRDNGPVTENDGTVTARETT